MDYDATRPLEGNCEIKLFQFSDAEGRVTRRPFAAGFAMVVFVGFLTPPTLVLTGVIS